MKEFKGTPGPWTASILPRDMVGRIRLAHISSRPEDATQSGDLFVHGRVCEESEETDIANYHLIAAAPDLLNALLAVNEYPFPESIQDKIDKALMKALLFEEQPKHN